ncbi:MAG: PIN domain-containing protein [Boseongicola sp.]|nr:PIN domain-containing protein [Boseongicola sp.]
MIYLDTSVALAWLLTEDWRPQVSVRDGTLVSSRLLECEIWTPLHSRSIADSHGEAARQPIGRVALLELTPRDLARALDAIPAPPRTLDSLHLASFAYLADQGQNVELASCDQRMNEVAREMDIPLFNPEAA